MNRLLIIFTVSILIFHSEAFAVDPMELDRPCPICLVDVSHEDVSSLKTITCVNNHGIHQECITHQVKTHENIKNLSDTGLSCAGKDCKAKFPLDQIKRILEPAEWDELQSRITKGSSQPTDSATEASRTDLQKLIQGIEEAFNLCCPNGKCGGVLAEVEGCNAAKCQNEKCNGFFCYLCLEPQKDSPSAHAHVGNHSNNAWEMRPGFKERYHWLIARKKFDDLFNPGSSQREATGLFKWLNLFRIKEKATTQLSAPVIRELKAAGLASRRALLESKHMWPMPAGLAGDRWVHEVKEANLPKDKAIELLQNESIYRRQQGDKKGAKIVEAELKSLGGKVLASLDYRDGPRAGVSNNNPAERLIAVVDGDENHRQVNSKFHRLGNMYRVGNRIWSGVPPGVTKNWEDATRFCADLGRGYRLPTNEEFGALARAMGRGTPAGYNRNRIPDMSGKHFWSSSVHFDPGYAYYFSGYYGDIYGYNRTVRNSVRCVRGI